MKLKNALLFTALFILSFSATAHSGVPIYFEGPKITNVHDRTDLGSGIAPMIRPGDFANPYDFKGSNTRNDVALPLSFRPMSILGLENLDNWGAGINQYFNQKNEIERHIPLQTVSGQFNGNADKDLLVVNRDGLVLCFDYHSVCNPVLSAAVSIDLFENNDPAKDKIMPWSAAVGDLDGDGKDDIAVIGFNEAGSRGFMVQLQGHNDGTAPAFVRSWEYTEGFPFSITLGKFDASGKLGAAVGVLPKTAPAAQIYYSKNVGNPSLNQPMPASDPIVDSNGKPVCYAPTGIVTYDPDTNVLDDVVLTCFQRNNASSGAGTVVTFKNNLAGSNKFEQQQIIDKFSAPFTSAVGDLNGDAKADLAVADNAQQVVATFAADAANPFGFDVTTYNPLPAFPYFPKYIKISDMNGADPDLVVSATLVRLPRFNYKSDLTYIDAAKLESFEFYSRDKSLSKSYYGSVSAVSFTDCSPNSKGYIKSSAYGYEYRPLDYTAERTGMTSFSFIPTDGTEVKDGTTAAYSWASATAPQVCNPDALLVYTNFRPQIVPDQPQCGNENAVTIHCLPSAGHTITACTVTTSESWNPNPQMTVVGNGKDVKITLPAQSTPVHYTVTATESAGGNTYTSQIEMLPPQCAPNPSITCAQTNIPTANVYWDDPWTVCVPDNIASQASGATRRIVWSTVGGGINVFNPTDGKIVQQAASSTGNCITGRFNPLSESQVTVQLNYAVQDVATGNDVLSGCKANVVFNPALIEGSGGSGARCSLDKSAESVSGVSIMFLLLLIPTFVFGLRKRTEMN